MGKENIHHLIAEINLDPDLSQGYIDGTTDSQEAACGADTERSALNRLGDLAIVLLYVSCSDGGGWSPCPAALMRGWSPCPEEQGEATEAAHQ